MKRKRKKVRRKAQAQKKKPELATSAAKRIKTGPTATIKGNEDILWAEATLAPLGLSPDGEPVVKAPAAVARPILEGLKAFQGMDSFRELLKTTSIGKVIN